MKKLASKKISKKLYLIILAAIVLVLLIFFAVYGILNGFNFTELMGNSVKETIYYCEDSSYTLNGKICSKKLQTASALFGDVDLDEDVNVKDATIINLYVAKRYELSELQLVAADVNRDGEVNNEDANFIQKSIAGIDNTNNSSTISISSTVYSTITNSKNLRIGIDKVCISGYTYNKNNDYCIKTNTVQAKSGSYLRGDVNLDNKVDQNDVTQIQEYLANLKTFNEAQKRIADYDNNGAVNINDVSYMQMDIANNQPNVSATLKIKGNVKINDIVVYDASFKVRGNNNYYYKWFDINGNKVSESSCNIVKNDFNTTLMINKNNDEYGILRIYSDNKCTELQKEYETEQVEVTEKKEESSVSMSYKLDNPINLTSKTVNKGTKLTFSATFNITGSKNYYMKWLAIKDGNTYATSECTKLTNGFVKKTDLTINGKDQHGVWDIYDDASCSNKVKTYQTDNYNYIADSITLNTSSTRIAVGNTATIKPTTKPANLSGIVWTSSNAAVATVNSNGVVTAKKSGTATITATIGGISAKATVIVVEQGNDTSINCPLLDYTEVNNVITMKVTPNGTMAKYDIYLANNGINGSYAKWSSNSNGLTGTKSININKTKVQQAKIVAYSKYGTTRNCYSSLFDLSKTYTVSSTASCPSFKYSYDKVSNSNIYNYKQGGISVSSGVGEMYVKANIDSNYQYSWYTSQKDGSYKLFKTYSTSTKSVSPSVTGNYYNRNGMFIVTDKNGNSIYCYSKYANNLKFNKTTYGNTDVYTESGYSSGDANTIKNIINNYNSSAPNYLGASKIFLLTSSTYISFFGKGTCGMTYGGPDIYIYYRPSGTIPGTSSNCGTSSNSDFFKGTIVHEIGHSMDFMYSSLSSKYLNTTNSMGTYFKNYKSTSYLRSYSFSSNAEFWADLFSYDKFKFTTDSNLKTLRNNMIKTYNNSYNSKKNQFNKLKDGWR